MLHCYGEKEGKESRLRVLYLEAEGEETNLFREIKEDLFSVMELRLFREEEEDPDIMDDLLQMHLIVFPVTKLLLAQEDGRVFRLIREAIKAGIPILPLLQTKKLREAVEIAKKEYDDVCAEGAPDAKEEAYGKRLDRAENELAQFIQDYNKAFDGRQYLDKGSPDKTELPFAVKLSSFLNSFLVDEKTERLVKAAFDAHIFMSYRKKDRGNMQKFMQMIHRQKNLENVAIWYDEFLIPGRNFDEVLKEKLRQCNLMTLAVTPNLLDTGNYVHEHEYPFALENGVKILPVELTRTDHSEYSRMYPKLPEPVPVDKEESVINRLTEILSAVAWSDRLDDDPHRYFLGIAYLYGIDTNVDREKGAAMIRSAAENGYTDAMEKYASMFFYGEAGTVSAEEAVQWQSKAVNQRERMLDEEETAENALALGKAYRAFGDYTHYLKQDATEFNVKAQKVLKKALDISDDEFMTEEILEVMESMTHRLRTKYTYEKRGGLNEGDMPQCDHMMLEIENVCILVEHHYKDYSVDSVTDLYKKFYDISARAWQHDFDMREEEFRLAERKWLEKYYAESGDPGCAVRMAEICFAENAPSKALEYLRKVPYKQNVPEELRRRQIRTLAEYGEWAELREVLENTSCVTGNSSKTGMKPQEEIKFYAICCGRLGDIQQAEKLLLGALDTMEQQYRKQFDKMRKEITGYSSREVVYLKKKWNYSEETDSIIQLKKAYLETADCFRDMGETAKAENYYLKALCTEEEVISRLGGNYCEYAEITGLRMLQDRMTDLYSMMMEKEEGSKRKEVETKKKDIRWRILSDMEMALNQKIKQSNYLNGDLENPEVIRMLREMISICRNLGDSARVAKFEDLKKRHEAIEEWQFEHRYRRF